MNAHEYCITRSPFELPITVIQVECKMSRTLCLESREGSNLATSIRGAFRAALYHLGCNPLNYSTNSTELSPECAKCVKQAICSVPFLFGPRSQAQRRDFASPIILWPAIKAEQNNIEGTSNTPAMLMCEFTVDCLLAYFF